MRAVTLGVLVALAGRLSAGTLHGLVFDDTNGDGVPSAGERGMANVVVALDVRRFVVTDASGQFDLAVPEGTTSGIVWARVPDGFRPGPAFGRWDGKADVDIALHRLPAPAVQPLTFVVAADTHLSNAHEYFGGEDLAVIASEAIALEPAPAFFTVLGDVSQGSHEADYALVDAALAGIGVPWVPVPGNHDWYDDGEAWFKHYGPDNYSFDMAGVHFVVWNMTMTDSAIRAYLGEELSHVDKAMPIVALTHAPPNPPVIAALRDLGVDYVLTGHAHSNRPTDHGGLIELNTEPMLMGGLDFTPAGYRVVTIEDNKLRSYHRTSVDAPLVTVVAPARGTCVAASGGELVVAAELGAGASVVTARVDCASPIALRAAGGWDFSGKLPVLARGVHTVAVDVTTATGERATTSASFEVCAPETRDAPPHEGRSWPQLGGSPTHEGARAADLAPPLAPRWTVAAGGQLLAAAPAIADGAVFVATTDLADGNTGAVVAVELATGAERWRVPTHMPVRGGVAIVVSAPPFGGAAGRGQAPAVGEGTPSTAVVAQIDGAVIGLDTRTGEQRWRSELSQNVQATAGAIFGAPATDGGDILVGHQRALAALAGHTGTPAWLADPVPEGVDSQSAAAVAIGDGVVVGTFERRLGGLGAWDRATGAELWRAQGEDIVAINASPVIGKDTVYVVTGADEVIALDLASGSVRWRNKLDAAGFGWGNATIGTPALAHGVLLVPTLYRDLVALDAATGAELWRRAGTPGPLRTTHYRGANEAGFEASPAITGGIAWSVDTAGELAARDLYTGDLLWRAQLGVPVLSGLATSGDTLVVASYDGSVRAFAPTARIPAADAPVTCSEPPEPGGCCDAGGGPTSALLAAGSLAAMLRRRR